MKLLRAPVLHEEEGMRTTVLHEEDVATPCRTYRTATRRSSSTESRSLVSIYFEGCPDCDCLALVSASSALGISSREVSGRQAAPQFQPHPATAPALDRLGAAMLSRRREMTV